MRNALVGRPFQAAAGLLPGVCGLAAMFCLTISPVVAFAQTNPARDLVNKYCVACHNEKAKTAGLDLTHADADHAANSAETWEKVIVKLRSRAMPPPGIPRPDNAAYDKVAGYLETEIDRAASAHANPGHSSNLHRLNRAEYANTVRDLFGVAIDPNAMLPPDEQAYGFENNADALSIQPALLDRYISAASNIARRVVGDTTIPPAFVRYGALKFSANDQTYLRQIDRMGEDFPLGSKGGVAAHHFFPVDGDYIIKLRLQRAWDTPIRGLNVQNQFEVFVDGKRVAQFTLGGEKNQPRTFVYDADEALQARIPIKAGMHAVVATMLKTDDIEAEGVGPDHLPLYSRQSDTTTAPVAIAALLIGGPYNGKIDPDSPSRKQLYVCHPTGPSDETPCATKIVSRLARRAYRRAATPDDVDTLLCFYKAARANGTFDDGIRAALERVLVSPDFLFRIEADPAGVAPGASYRVSDVDLASRLSFFLWSSTPDDTLLDLAIANRLHDPAVLDKQVARMVADPRARKSLVDNFFSDWLEIRNVWLLNPESTKFPWFDDNLRTAFVTETEMFLDAQLKENHSVIDLLTSDETFLNEQLARHYGISGVYGSHFRKVKLTDENRFGLLGKASILAVTSYTTRTSPTIRGKWLLSKISSPRRRPLLRRTCLRSNPATRTTSLSASVRCSKCIAPTPFAPVATRAWTRSASVSKTSTPSGSGAPPMPAIPSTPPAFCSTARKSTARANSAGSRGAEKSKFAGAVTEKLLTYALGRGLEYYDAPTVRAIDRAAAADDYRWSSVMPAIVKSPPIPDDRRRSEPPVPLLKKIGQ